MAKLAVGPMDNNAYLLTCTVTGTAVLIDAASEAGRLIELIGSTPVTRIVTTHRRCAVLRRRVLRPGRLRGSGPGTCTGHRDRVPLQLKARGLVPRVSLVCLRWRGLADRRPG